MVLKITLFSVSVIILVVFAIGYWLTGSSSQSAPTPVVQSPSSDLPVSSGIQVYSNNNAVSNVTSGFTASTTEAQNIQSDPALVMDPINPGLYYLGYHTNMGVNDATATDSPPYIIAYTASTNYFNISLLQEPIGIVRNEAEQYLMSHLSMSQAQMCKLNYTLSVPNSVSSQYAGANLGFSFCPGAIPLPQ